MGGGAAEAETVRVELAVDPALMVEGLNAQVRPALAAQLREIGLLNPPTAAALTVTFAEPPEARVTLGLERLSEKFALVTAAAGTTLANTLVVLPPAGKFGWLPPPAVRKRVPELPDAPPPPNTMSHKPGFTSGVFAELVTWPRKFPFVSNALMVPSPKFPTRIEFGNWPKVDGAATTPQGALR